MQDGSGEVSMEDTIHTVEVRQSFKNHSTFFKSYLVRTVFECLCSLLITGYLALSGISELMNWNNLDLQEKTELIRSLEVNELINVRRDKVRVFCDVHGSWYECSGVPTQFYLYVLIASLALLPCPPPRLPRHHLPHHLLAPLPLSGNHGKVRQIY